MVPRAERGRVETFFDGEKLEDLEHRIGLEPGGLTSDAAVIYICGLRGTIAAVSANGLPLLLIHAGDTASLCNSRHGGGQPLAEDALVHPFV